MTVANEPAGYTGTQILLHWAIAALIVLQLVLGEDIKPAYRAFSRGTEPAAADIFNANIHVYVGLAVLVLAIWRLAIRLQRGVPAAPPEESVVLKRIAAATHFAALSVHFRHAGYWGAGMVLRLQGHGRDTRTRQAGHHHCRRPPCGRRAVAAFLPEIGCARQDVATGRDGAYAVTS